MLPKNIDIFNIGLIVISLVIAVLIPFELFLFSYAVLGPLHYLTEINWLNKKDYFFSANKSWSIVFIFLGILISIIPMFTFLGINTDSSDFNLLKIIFKNSGTVLLIGFLFAVALLFIKESIKLIYALIMIVIIAVTSTVYYPNLFFIGLFLPTLIHVYVFTFLFILYGSLKGKSNYGILLSIVLLSIPFVIAFLPIDVSYYSPSSEIKETFATTSMLTVGKYVAEILNNFNKEEYYVLSDIGIRIQIFISFAYTYHYLNWFSKIDVIGWKKSISKTTGTLIIMLWIISIGLYFYDYKTGIVLLFFLSFLHVLLEFPLNAMSIKGIIGMSRNKH